MTTSKYKIVAHSGPIDSDIVVVGDEPTEYEVRTGAAFTGNMGDVVKDILYHCGFDPDKVLFINAINYRKYGKVPLTVEQIRENADEILMPIINRHPRQLVIALGNVAACATGIVEEPKGVNKLRGRLLSSRLHDYRTVVSIHPFYLVQKPDEVDDFYTDVRYAKRMADGDTNEQVPVHIIDLETPSSLEAMLNETVSDYPYLAYDYEGTNKTTKHLKVVTCAFANGSFEDGVRKGYFWGGYDKLRPRFEDHILKQFIEGFDHIFSRAGKDYALIAHNAAFDDKVSQILVNHELPGCTYDTMLLKWVVNNKGKHNLKDSVARYLGYPDYEKELGKYIKQIQDRRGRILSHEEDFFVLDHFGIEAGVSKSGKATWPDTLDKKFAAYAMVPYETLRLYNVYDAVYTRMLFDYLYNRISKENLSVTAKYRHVFARDLMQCEWRGIKLDVKTNREFSEKAQDVEDKCKLQIQDLVFKIDPKLEDFNPNSNDDLGKILFGEPVDVPSVDKEHVYKLFGQYRLWDLDKRIQAFEDAFYGDLSKIKLAVEQGAFSFEQCAKAYKSNWDRCFPEFTEARIKTKKLYCNGLYTPKKFSKKTNAPSCAGEVLKSLYVEKQHDLLTLILMYRKANKLRSTFIDAPWKNRDINDICYPRYNPVGTETGRISSSGFNAQNLPKYLRGLFIAREGYGFVEGDLAQAEIRVVAALSGDKNLLQALEDGDIHYNVASQIFKKPIPKDPDNPQPGDVTEEERRYAKTIVFGIIYGMSAFRLSLAIGVDEYTAQEFIDLFYQGFPTLKAWLDSMVDFASEKPWYVYTPFGTRRSTRGLLSVDYKVKTHTARVAQNTPVQGGAGELTLYYIHEILNECKKRGWGVYLTNTTHDSFLFETPKALMQDMSDLIKEVVARVVPIKPLDAVTFKVDVKIPDLYWSTKPNLEKALDPKNDLFNWALIRGELDKKDEEELQELEAELGIA
jgi:uracil-DNA glycosylase family 4